MDYDDEETDSDEDIRETYGYDMKVITWTGCADTCWVAEFVRKAIEYDVWGLKVEKKILLAIYLSWVYGDGIFFNAPKIDRWNSIL